MASHGNHQYNLDEEQRRSLARRLLLDEQRRRIESRKMLEASVRAPICPNYSLSGHSTCWYCHQNGNVQPTTSTDTLLNSLTRPQSQATPTPSKADTSYLPSSASTDNTISQLTQLITPRSTASNIHLTDNTAQNKDPYRRIISSKPRVPASTPTKPVAATPLALLTQPKPIPPPPYRELPVEKGFVPVRVPATFSHFIYLPLELRKRIYAYLVHNGIHGLLPPKDMRVYHQAAITRVNRQIRSESIDMVYTSNAFNASSRDLIKQGLPFANHVGDDKLRLIRSWLWFTAKRYLFITFTPSGRGYQHRVDYRAPDGNQEIGNVAFERATQVYDYLRHEPHVAFGLTSKDVGTITDIVLRITPKVKPKKEEETAL